MIETKATFLIVAGMISHQIAVKNIHTASEISRIRMTHFFFLCIHVHITRLSNCKNEPASLLNLNYQKNSLLRHETNDSFLLFLALVHSFGLGMELKIMPETYPSLEPIS